MKKKLLTGLFVSIVIILSACSVSKVRDFSGYPNLLLGTNNGTANFGLLDKNYDGSIEAEGDGIIVKMASHDDSGWLVLYYDDGHSREILSGPEGDKYTISFDVKTNKKGTDIRVSHRNGNWSDNQIDFGSRIIEKADKWVQVVMTGSLTGTNATSQFLYIDLRNNPADTEVNIRNLKLIREPEK